MVCVILIVAVGSDKAPYSFALITQYIIFYFYFCSQISETMIAVPEDFVCFKSNMNQCTG